MWVRKNTPGADNLGHTWPEAGSVVEVDPSHVPVLLGIPDAGFSLVAGPDETDANPVDPVDVVDVVDAPAEAAPDGNTSVARTTRARKTTA